MKQKQEGGVMCASKSMDVKQETAYNIYDAGLTRNF